MLLVAAKILAAHRSELHGNVKLVFEPNEEESGAQHMVREGALENPRVDASFAMHVNASVETGRIGLSAVSYTHLDMDLNLQARILRVLEEREVLRIGGDTTYPCLLYTSRCV